MRRARPLRSLLKNRPRFMIHTAMACAAAALCLFGAWAASAAHGDSRAAGAHLAPGGKAAAYTEGASHDYATATFDGLERYATWENADGKSATYQPEGPFTAENPFFKPLGTNGRACVTCHDPSAGWTITPVHIRARF